MPCAEEKAIRWFITTTKKPTFFSSVFINSITNKNIKFSSKYKSFSRILLNKKKKYKSWKNSSEKQTGSLHEHHIEQIQTPKDYAYKYWKTHNTDTMLYWDKKIIIQLLRLHHF